MRIIFILTLFLASSGCSSSKKTILSTKTPYEIGLSINQGENEIKIKGQRQTVELKKEEFNLVFNLYRDLEHLPTSRYARIAFIHDSEYLEFFKEGSIDNYDNPFFSPGTSYAGYLDDIYSSAISRDNGNHAVYYKDEKNRRMEKVEDIGNEIIRGNWNINAFTTDDSPETLIEELKINTFFMMLFVDINNDMIIDEHEYHIVTINFN